MLTSLRHPARVPVILVCVYLIVAGLRASPIEVQLQAATTIAGESFIVSGTVVREDKTPIGGITVMIAEAKDDGYAVGIGERGVVQNPSATSDAQGRFSIRVPRALFKERREFVVVVPFFDRAALPIRHRGSAVAVKIDNTTKEYKLGAIGAANPVIR